MLGYLKSFTRVPFPFLVFIMSSNIQLRKDLDAKYCFFALCLFLCHVLLKEVHVLCIKHWHIIYCNPQDLLNDIFSTPSSF